MKEKTNIRKSLEGKRSILFSSGILISLALCLLAFEWGKTNYRIELPDDFNTMGDFVEDDIVATKTPEAEIPKPQPSYKFIIVDGFDDPDPIITLFDPEPSKDFKLLPYIPPMEVEEGGDDPVLARFIEIGDLPSFPGGDEALATFMGNNLKYPKLAVETHISGTVYVEFVVGKDGSISNIRLLKDIGGGCGAEAVRVVSLMPKWNPGNQRGKPVKVKMVYPVSFRLSSN